MRFDSARAEELIAGWRETGDLGTLGDILELARPLIQVECRKRKTDEYYELEELISVIQIKLMRVLKDFDRARGSAYTFVSRVIWSHSCTLVTERQLYLSRYVQIEDPLFWELIPAPEKGDPELLEEIETRIRGVELSDLQEREAARWLAEQMAETEFTCRRREYGKQVRERYGLGKARSLELHDLVMSKVRCVLNDLNGT